jgi:hypothetical protein
MWTVFCFATFTVGFHILGYIDLVTDFRVVDPGLGSVILSVLLGLVFYGMKKWPAPVSEVAAKSRFYSAGRPFLPGNRLARSLTVTIIAILTAIALMLCAGFPRGYEAEAYHLPIGVHIFQAHSLKVWRVWETTFAHTFPANASLYFGYLLGFLPEHLVAMAGMVFLVPMGVASYGIARATGADDTASVLASLGLLTIPILLNPAFEAGSDVGGAAFLAVAIYFALKRPTGRQWDLIIAGLAGGLAFGFKSLHLIGMVFVALIVLCQAWNASEGHAVRRRLWRLAHPVVILLAATFLTAGFWPIRNYAELGNPLYPVYSPFFKLLGWKESWDFARVSNGTRQFGWVRSSAEWFVYPWIEWASGPDKPGLGPFFAATVPIACLGALIAGLKRDDDNWPTIVALLGGGLFILTVWWFLNDRQPRYFIGALVFLVPLVASTICQVTGRSRVVLENVVAVCIMTALLSIFSVELIRFGELFIYTKHFARSTFYGYPGTLDRLPPGATVMNLGHRTRNYSLFGATHRNRAVVYLEAFYAFGMLAPNADEAAQEGHLAYPLLRNAGITHILAEGNTMFSVDECVHLQKIAGLDKDLLGKALEKPISLYEVTFCR